MFLSHCSKNWLARNDVQFFVFILDFTLFMKFKGKKSHSGEEVTLLHSPHKRGCTQLIQQFNFEHSDQREDVR